jgi:di/tricarboxylate transporter
VGKTLPESGFGRELDLRVLRVLREGRDPAFPRDTTTLREGDVLIVEGEREEILKIKDVGGLEIRPDVELNLEEPGTKDLVLAEALVLPGSALIGRTLKAYGFLERHGLQVLAIHRHGVTLREKLSRVRLRLGDALLVQGRQARLVDMEAQNVLRVVGAETGQRPRLSHAWTAVGIFAGAILLAAFKVLPVPVAFMTGEFVALATQCITPQEAYQDVEWKVLILIGSMLALGAAMEDTGAAQFLAHRIIDVIGHSGRPFWLLTGVFALTVALTQPMSNQAAAIIVLPIAIQTALATGHNPRTFAMMVAVAASVSYLTPLEPACLMVYGPGRYRFADFLRVGALLTLIVYAIAITLVPMVWPPGP